MLTPVSSGVAPDGSLAAGAGPGPAARFAISVYPSALAGLAPSASRRVSETSMHSGYEGPRIGTLPSDLAAGGAAGPRTSPASDSHATGGGPSPPAPGTRPASGTAIDSPLAGTNIPCARLAFSSALADEQAWPRGPPALLRDGPVMARDAMSAH